MSDFSLMDAIECGIVKLPRVPTAENIPGDEMPKYRDLWENLKTANPRLPKAGRNVAHQSGPVLKTADASANRSPILVRSLRKDL